MPRDTADRLAIRALVENWALWRDARMWDRFRTVWHKEGQMWATWFQGSYEEFIRVSQEGYDRGVRIMHMLGGMSIDIKGKRAIAQTKMTISQRAPVEGVVCATSYAPDVFTIFWKSAAAGGVLSCAVSHTKRTGSMQSILRQSSSLTKPCWRNFRRATATSPTCKPKSATRSSATCPASTVPTSMPSMPRAKRGSRAESYT